MKLNSLESGSQLLEELLLLRILSQLLVLFTGLSMTNADGLVKTTFMELISFQIE